MSYLCIQIQPELAPSIEGEKVTVFLKNEGYAPEITEGNDQGKYINICTSSDNIKELWGKINNYLKESIELSRTSIVTCEGSQGWDNYLLLHHFDSTQKIDEI